LLQAKVSKVTTNVLNANITVL